MGYLSYQHWLFNVPKPLLWIHFYKFLHHQSLLPTSTPVLENFKSLPFIPSLIHSFFKYFFPFPLSLAATTLSIFKVKFLKEKWNLLNQLSDLIALQSPSPTMLLW